MSARPIIFIAYGERGTSWLARAAELSRMQPRLALLVDARVVQFWLVLDEGRTDGRIEHTTIVASGSPPVHLRELLEEGRSVRNRSRVGELDLNTSLVLERWSLFEPAAEARVGLRASLDAARRIDCVPDGDKEFDYEWVSLADCVRDPARPDTATIERARKILETDALRDLPLIIDRIDGTGASIDRDMTDQCFLEAALALADSVFGLPDPTVASTLPASLASDPPKGTAIPLSVAALRHPITGIWELAAQQLREALLSDAIDPNLFRTNTEVPELLRLLEMETTELERGSFSTRHARSRRKASAIELLQTAFIHRIDCTEFVSALQQIRSRLHSENLAPADANAVDSSTRTNSFSPQEESSPEIGSGVFWGLRAVIVRALDAFSRVRAQARVTAPAAERLPLQRPAEVREQWEAVCQRLEHLIEEWRDLCVSARRTRPDSTSGAAWVRSTDAYCDWKLGQLWPAQRLVLDPRIFFDVARECLQFVETGVPARKSIDHAILEVTRRRLDSGEQVLGTVLRAALAQPLSEPVAKTLRQLPLMANAGAGIPIREVVWLARRDLGINSHLQALEPASTRHAFQSLHQENAAATVRLALGEPTPWPSFLSLSFLREE